MQPGGTEVIHVNFRSAEVDPVYFPQYEVIGDIGNAIWQIKEDILPQSSWDFQAMHAARDAEVAHTRQVRDRPALPDLPADPGQADPRRHAARRHHLPRQRRL
jgi:acetolactate synthase-1/2/3 large subunit